MTRVRLSMMVSQELNEDLEKVYHAESSKATQNRLSPPPRSRVFEKLLALGLSQYRQQEVKPNEARDADHKD